jgi:hypothetical protein
MVDEDLGVGSISLEMGTSLLPYGQIEDYFSSTLVFRRDTGRLVAVTGTQYIGDDLGKVERDLFVALIHAQLDREMGYIPGCQRHRRDPPGPSF